MIRIIFIKNSKQVKESNSLESKTIIKYSNIKIIHKVYKNYHMQITVVINKRQIT